MEPDGITYGIATADVSQISMAACAAQSAISRASFINAFTKNAADLFPDAKLTCMAAEPALRIEAGNAAFDQRIRNMAESVQGRVRYHTIELPDGSVLPGLQPVAHLRHRLSHFVLPDDLRGRRVLDVGAWDGWFTFECERRGAQVTAVDCVELETFREAHRLLGSRAEYLILDVNELSAARLGTFDIVLFFGVLYHLRHPLLGLEKMVELTTDLALVESFVIQPEPRAIPAVMEFYERGELGGQMDNWCGPSPECLLALCRSAGFASAELRDVTSNRASVVCRRRWPEPPAAPRESAPHLISAVNSRTYTSTFQAGKDEYVCCYFRCTQRDLTPENLLIEIDGFGVPALTVDSTGEGAWQSNCLRPPSLGPGVHSVRLRCQESARSNAVEFTVLGREGHVPASPLRDLPAGAPDLCSAQLHAPSDLRLASNRFGSLVLYFRSPAEVLAAQDVVIEMDGQIVQPQTVGSPEPGVWQANFFLTSAPETATRVRLRLGSGEWSEWLPATRITG